MAMHGHMWIPMQTGIQEQYAALEEELMPGDRSNSFDDNMEKSSLDGVDTSKLDAKTLARLKVIMEPLVFDMHTPCSHTHTHTHTC